MRPHPAPVIYELGPDFYDEVPAALFPQAVLRYRNQSAASLLGLEDLTTEDWKKHFYSFHPLPQNLSQPLALRYHGHQFQHYNPDLGDGRGFLFAQFKVGETIYDLGTKGSGQTPYSRKGDGRLTLKGAFREILATELLESYGVPTSKTFSVFETGEQLQRHDEPSPTRAAVLVRMNHSHIRYGTFQRLATLGQKENLQKLLSYCVRHYYPELECYEGTELAGRFLQAVSDRAAETTAAWMIAGFVHGVLNTDNMNITGESFDYGPYRFLPSYDPYFTAAYFDHNGLYCYGRQPMAVHWNLHQLGLSLKSAFPDLDVTAQLEHFAENFTLHSHDRLLRRLNLKNKTQYTSEMAELNSLLLTRLFEFIQKTKAFFEQTLFDLHSGYDPERLKRSPQRGVYEDPSFKDVEAVLQNYEVALPSIKSHAYFKQSHACSLLIDELESLWQPIADHDDWQAFTQKLQQIRSFRGVYF